MPSFFDIVLVMLKVFPVRRLLVAASVVSLTWFAGAWAQSAPESPPAGQVPLSFKVLVDQIIGLFPVVQTEVIEVAGSSVTLASGRAQGVQAGIELVGYREGRELYHPRTKQLLGRTEETLGRVVVVQVFENYSVANQVDGLKLQPGDKARVTAGKVRLTVLPFTPVARARVAEAATLEVIQELERTGRFQIGFGDQVTAWLAQEKIGADDFMKGKGVREAVQKFNLTNLLALEFS